MNSSVPLIQPLVECEDKALVGGKAVNLGRLLRARFPVPGGYCITTAAYRACGGIEIAPDLARQIVLAYHEMGSPPVAVRSSATAEDLAEASMAGQYETLLDINGDEALLAAVVHCWKSIDSPRIRTYLKEHGIDTSQLAMAVVVQRLVPADVAGVLFTANPRTGMRNEMLIEASWGLGEAVVSGMVQPDVLRIDYNDAHIISKRIAEKQVMIAPGSHGEQPVPEGRRKVACLSDGDVKALHQLGRQAVDHFGSPQDLEWAIRAGELFLLQSRAITTLEEAEATERVLQLTREELRRLSEDGRGPWVLHNIAETLPHPTPLTWSIIRRFMSGDGGFGAMYRQVGFDPSRHVRREGFLDLVAGEVYMDLSLAPGMFFEDFPFEYDLETVRSNPDAAQSPPTIPGGTLRQRMRAARRLARINRSIRALADNLDRELNERTIPQFVAWVKQEKQRDLTALSREQFADLWRERQHKVLDEFAPQSLLPSLVSGNAVADLKSFVEENFWDEDADALANLLASGHAPDKTVQANVALDEVAHGTRSVDEWLVDFGHRAPEEFDLATPRWREQPAQLMEMAERLKTGVNPAERHQEHLREIGDRLADLRRQLEPVDRERMDDLLELARRYLPFREDGKYYLMLGYDLLRDIAKEAGRRLEIADEVFLLSEGEVLSAIKSGVVPQVQSARKIERRAEKRLSLPPVIDAPTIDALGKPADVHAAHTHAAFAVSSGQARGPARIVLSPQEAGDLGSGYILVCPSTDPAWTPLFVNAAGLVLERGGTLSHGAVVAREMSIPAVVLPNSTTLFHDGEMIGIDGRNGSVTRLANGSADSTAEADPKDVRIPRHLTPPPAGRRERAGAKLRNIFLIVWGVYLTAAYTLPDTWIYQPTLRLIDKFLWPLTQGVGKVGAVMVVASIIATLTMLGQFFLTDNRRLREAKHRVALLTKQIAKLPAESPRRLAMRSLTAPVHIRVFAAAMVPLAVLLGPMVMTFVWFPARVDPTVWSPPPGTDITIEATIAGEHARPVTLSVAEPLRLDNPSAATFTMPEVRKLLDPLTTRPSLMRPTNSQEQERSLSDLRQFLNHIPPHREIWRIHSDAKSAGAFPVTISTPGQKPLSINVILGESSPPDVTEVEGDSGSPLMALKIGYPKSEQQQVFWAPLAMIGYGHWDAGWLMTYLIAYLPVMFAIRFALRIA